FFAAFYKLNSVWFSSRSSAPGFLVPLAAPVVSALGLPAGPVERLLAAIAIYGTLVIEFGLPLLLFRPSTRLLGCVVGVGFHLLLVAGGFVTFPLLIIAFYPAFLSLPEPRRLLESLRRPTVARLTGTALVGAGGLWAVATMPKRWMYRPPAHALVVGANDVLM